MFSCTKDVEHMSSQSKELSLVMQKMDQKDQTVVIIKK